MEKETNLQAKVIGQLQNLCESYKTQTKPMCMYGHFGCHISHHIYNYVNSVSQPTIKSQPFCLKKTTCIRMKKYWHDKLHPNKLQKEIGQLQAIYGLPPSLKGPYGEKFNSNML